MMTDLKSTWLKVVCITAAISVMAGCIGGLPPNPIERDPQVQHAFSVLQPFADEVVATYKRTGQFPKNSDDLFMAREWPGFIIEKGKKPYYANYGVNSKTGKTIDIPSGDAIKYVNYLKSGNYYIVTPIGERNLRLIVGYGDFDEYYQLNLVIYNYMSRGLQRGDSLSHGGPCRWNFDFNNPKRNDYWCSGYRDHL